MYCLNLDYELQIIEDLDVERRQTKDLQATSLKKLKDKKLYALKQLNDMSASNYPENLIKKK